MKKLLIVSLLIVPFMTLQAQSKAPFEVQPLPYAYDAMAPYCSEMTMTLHHDKHYAGYVATVNKMVPGTKFEDMTLEEIILNSDGVLFNNAAQAWNHQLYFAQFNKEGAKAPTGKLLEAVNKSFGSLEALKAQTSKVAGALFGSGWVWLAADADGNLQIIPEPNAGNPLKAGLTTLFGIDLWEHAYYLDYQNRRLDCVDAFWEILDWNVVEARFK